MKNTRIFTLISISFLLVFLSPVPEGFAQEYEVVNVIDGDTVELAGGERVRYLHIDTPETRKRIGREWFYDPEPFAEAAAKFNKTRVLKKNVTLEFDKNRRDRYRRLLAFVFRGDQMINLELVKRGLARVLIIQPNNKYVTDFFEAEAKAMSERKGIWSDLREIPPQEAAENLGKYRTLRGKIINVNAFRRAFILDIDTGSSNYTFKVLIFEKNLHYFREKGIIPGGNMKGKTIEVTGMIQDKGGPAVVLFNPFMVNVL